MDLKDMDLKQLIDLKKDKIYCLQGVIKMCKQFGNKDYKNNVMVKAYLDKINEIEKEIETRG